MEVEFQGLASLEGQLAVDPKEYQALEVLERSLSIFLFLNFVFEPQFVLIVLLTVVFFFSKLQDLFPVVLGALVLRVPLWVVLVVAVAGTV